MPQVSIIVVNWNGRHYLPACLTAALAQTFADCEIVLSDNGSTDGSLELVREEFPSVRIIENGRNLGFGGGINRALHATDSPLIATLNPDTQVEPGWLEALVDVLESAADVGMCASKMLFASAPNVINSAGIALDRAGIAWDRRGGQRDDPADTDPEDVFGPCGGAALYRRTMLEQIGLFDEAFFLYLEDVDVAWRAQLAGWRALYVPRARVYHHHSATAQEGSPLKRHALGRNKIWLIAKNYPAPSLLFYLPVMLFYDLLAVGYTFVIQRDTSPLKGRLEGLRGLPAMLEKRRQVQRLRSRSGLAATRCLEPVTTPWRVWKRFAHLEQRAT